MNSKDREQRRQEVDAAIQDAKDQDLYEVSEHLTSHIDLDYMTDEELIILARKVLRDGPDEVMVGEFGKNYREPEPEPAGANWRDDTHTIYIKDDGHTIGTPIYYSAFCSKLVEDHSRWIAYINLVDEEREPKIPELYNGDGTIAMGEDMRDPFYYRCRDVWKELDEFTSEQRVEIFNGYCAVCGGVEHNKESVGCVCF